MAIDFPQNPVDGQSYTYEDVTYVWQAADSIWLSVAEAVKLFRRNAQTVTEDTVIKFDENAVAAGPIEVAAGITLEVETGGSLSIV